MDDLAGVALVERDEHHASAWHGLVELEVTMTVRGHHGDAIFAPGYPKSAQIACNSDALVSGIEPTVTAGGSSLSYNATTDQYAYVWKTDQAWAKTCRQLVLEIQDGSLHRANFTFK